MIMLRKLAQILTIALFLSAASFASYADNKTDEEINGAAAKCEDNATVNETGLFTPNEKIKFCDALGSHFKANSSINYIEYIKDFSDANPVLVITSIGVSNSETLFLTADRDGFVIAKTIVDNREDYSPSESDVFNIGGIYYQVEGSSDHNGPILPRQLYRINKDFSRTALGEEFEFYPNRNNYNETDGSAEMVLSEGKDKRLNIRFVGDYRYVDLLNGRYAPEKGNVAIELVGKKWRVVSGKKIKREENNEEY